MSKQLDGLNIGCVQRDCAKGRADFHRECGDTDAILRMLGLDPFRCRTDGGSLRLARISDLLEHRKCDELRICALRADAERMHIAMCQSLSLLNISPELARCIRGREARDILRLALLAHADAAMAGKAVES